MPNPLDPIWRSYDVIQESLGVIRLSLDLSSRSTTLYGTQFATLSNAEITERLDAAGHDADDQAVLFLYATFESALRDHVVAQAGRLAAADSPNAQFGIELQAWFAALCRDARMDGISALFAPAVGTALAPLVGSIRKYRHWLAHGKRGTAPPSVAPQFVYTTLTQFLQACGLA